MRKSRAGRRRKWTRSAALLAAAVAAALVAARAGVPPGPALAAKGPFAPVAAKLKPNIAARSASLFLNGQLVYTKLGTTPEPTASTTKMMTAYVALTHPGAGLLQKKYRITQKEVDEMRAHVAQNDQELQVRLGEVYTGADLFAAMMLPSDNNAASMLASAYPGGQAAFVALMNQTAAQLGLSGAHFADPSGLSSQDLMSATDVARLAMDGLKLPAFRNIVGTRRRQLSTGLTVQNLNRLLGHYAGATGVKTGWTVPAGHCLAFSATRTVQGESVTLVGSVMGEPSWTVLYKDVRQLLDEGFVTVPTLTLKRGTPIATASWGFGIKTTLRLSKTAAVSGRGPFTVGAIHLSAGGAHGTFLLKGGSGATTLPLEGPRLPLWYTWLRALP